MPSRRRSRSRHGNSRRQRGERRSQNRGQEGSPRHRSPSHSAEDEEGELFLLEVLAGRHQDPEPMYDILVKDEDGERVVAHVCARADEGYVIRVTNNSRHHVACAISVDGENALLKDGSLIVAPGDRRELPGYLVSKNFVGKEYVKEYRDFRFGKPKVVEGGASDPSVEKLPYTTYGRIVCDVYEAVLDEEVDSDKELHGQTTHYRGAGLNGSNEERLVPEGKKKHFLYSSVTVQGPRSSIANSTRGRWWIRGSRKLRTLEVRHREAHTLMLLGVDPRALGLAHVKQEDSSFIKDEKLKKEELLEEKLGKPGLLDVCDLTAEDEGGVATWTTEERSLQAAAVDDIDNGALVS